MFKVFRVFRVFREFCLRFNKGYYEECLRVYRFLRRVLGVKGLLLRGSIVASRRVQDPPSTLKQGLKLRVFRV